jgi:hypothetical protein
MTRFVRLCLLGAALSVPAFLTAAPAAASGPSAPFEEVAAARDGTTARAQHRTRRHSATAQRRQRQAATRTRRARAAQG